MNDVAVAVLGGGPGGYSAAFRAADLGRSVALIERYPRLGGVCLNVGCIPSKALLHLAAVSREARGLHAHGVVFAEPTLYPRRIAAFKDDLIARLGDGLASLARRRKVQVIEDSAAFLSPHRMRLAKSGEVLGFEHAIIATGSRNAVPPELPRDHPRVLDSTAALRFEAIPERLLIIGGGVIGVEMACLYEGLGARVSLIESEARLLGECDDDVGAPLCARLTRSCEILTNTRVRRVAARVEAKGAGALTVWFEGAAAPASGERFDAIIAAVGRKPNSDALRLERAGVACDSRGFITTDDGQRTNVPHVYAVGDVTGPPMLAHKATHQGKVAAENAAGREAGFDGRAIPSVVYSDPEIAWVGVTEIQARQSGLDYKKAVFPWRANGRALATGRGDGLTKLLLDPRGNVLLGAGICGNGAGDLIAEAALAMEMAADAGDVALTMHPHPTLSETVGLAAELAEGVITDLFPGDAARLARQSSPPARS